MRWQVSPNAALGVEAHRTTGSAVEADQNMKLEARLHRRSSSVARGVDSLNAAAAHAGMNQAKELRPERIYVCSPPTRGWTDLLLETDAGWIVIDHKSSPRPRPEWAAEAIGSSGQLAAYVTALRASGMECAGCWLHLPVGGGLVEVVLPHTSRDILTHQKPM